MSFGFSAGTRYPLDRRTGATLLRLEQAGSGDGLLDLGSELSKASITVRLRTDEPPRSTPNRLPLLQRPHNFILVADIGP